MEELKKKFFKKTEETSLAGLLMTRTKADLDEFRINFGIVNASQYNKKQLADALSLLLPDLVEENLDDINDEILGYLNKAIECKGMIPEEEVSINMGIDIYYMSFLFPVKRSEGKFYVVPDEIFDILLTVDDVELDETAKRNSMLYKIIDGLINVYGVLEYKTIHEMTCRYMRERIDFSDFFHKLLFAEQLYESTEAFRNFCCSALCDDPQDVFMEGYERNIDYRRFTRKYIIAHSDPDYYEPNKDTDRLKYSLIKHFDLDRPYATSMVSFIAYLIQIDSGITEIVEYIDSETGGFTEEFADEFADIFMELNNNTPKWILRGHSPNELNELGEFDTEPAINISDKIDYSSGNKNKKPSLTLIKTGRNEPCPCGSGKKHKDCCGKN